MLNTGYQIPINSKTVVKKTIRFFNLKPTGATVNNKRFPELP